MPQRRPPLLVLSLAFAAVTACKSRPQAAEAHVSESAPRASTPSPLSVDQGWSAADREWFYFTTQGSRFIPYGMFLALEMPDGEDLLRTPARMAELGYQGAGPSARNPDGLPIGFAKSQAADGAWVGMSCAACHTAHWQFQGRTVRVDGAASPADFFGLVKRVEASVRATLADPGKLTRYVANRADDKDGQKATEATARAELEAVARELGEYFTRNTPKHPWGNFRVDPFNVLSNEILAVSLQVPANVRQPMAPLKYQTLWNTGRLAWQGSNGSVNNEVARMTLEVLGVFGRLRLADAATPSFTSSIPIENLHAMYEKLMDLRPPAWPAGVFGAVDAGRAARGAALYARECARCHADREPYPMTPPNKYGKSFIVVTRVPAAEIGTDDAFLRVVAERDAETGPLARMAQGAPKLNALALERLVVGAFLKGEFARKALTPAQLVAYAGYHEIEPPGDTNGYKAKPLAGIWAGAPYLHNASVPTLWDLLAKPADRPRRFTASGAYDPVKVGLDTAKPAGGGTDYDTRAEGNGNGGHAYGTGLGDDEKWDLIAYLKTL